MQGERDPCTKLSGPKKKQSGTSEKQLSLIDIYIHTTAKEQVCKWDGVPAQHQKLLQAQASRTKVMELGKDPTAWNNATFIIQITFLRYGIFEFGWNCLR